jgi:hypothetical protein
MKASHKKTEINNYSQPFQIWCIISEIQNINHVQAQCYITVSTQQHNDNTY